MTTITEGMTPDQFIIALNNNNVELCTNWSVLGDSFTTLTALMASSELLFDLNYNLRIKTLALGQKGSIFANILNSGFASTVHRFQDNFLENPFAIIGNTAEPTALVSDDGLQLDLWCGANIGVGVGYTYSTDGVNFAPFQAIDLPNLYWRIHICKYDGVYYLTSSINDISIHLFTSTDKIHFTNLGEIIGRGGVGSFDEYGVANCFIWREGSNWFALYDALDITATSWTQGLATASAPTGPWTKYAGNPVLTGIADGAGQAELARVNNEVIKHNGMYYLYYQNGNFNVLGNLARAYSSDLINWTKEGAIIDTRKIHNPLWSYGDQCLVQFKGKSYLFWSAADQLGMAHLDIGIDNRPLTEMLALCP